MKSPLSSLFLPASIFLSLIAVATAFAQNVPDSWSQGSPVLIPSGDVKINGMFFAGTGGGVHPTLIYFHGLPGFAGDLDLPAPISRGGWNVLTLHYRGSWGSPGDYSYAHQLEDARAAMAFVRKNAESLRAEPARIVIAGHSTGGLIALITAADAPGVAGVIAISPSDDSQEILDRNASQPPPASSHPCPPMLRGCTTEGLDRETLEHADEWKFSALAVRLPKMPMLLISSDDPYAGEDDALEKALVDRGKTPARVRMKTGHSYAGKHPELADVIANWLGQML
jgi:pimeloyl-ACP methyl ester carboxylesterase